jgi:hypothetical protein
MAGRIRSSHLLSVYESYLESVSRCHPGCTNATVWSRSGDSKPSRSDRKWKISTNGGYEPRWRRDGRELYYLSEERKLMAVVVSTTQVFEALLTQWHAGKEPRTPMVLGPVYTSSRSPASPVRLVR